MDMIRSRQITVKRKGFIDHLQRRLIQVNKVKPPYCPQHYRGDY